ncbi:heterokaryon incompatibility protein-domain-containing protein [Xylariaceae sp. AK1471]|nr:heterokaryon incompatibility protein-domain-containing protein [Xylariaceae sp. AK1471]
MDDLGDSLSAIRERYGQPIATLLLDIQKSRIRNLKSAEFVQALECLCLSADSSNVSAGVWPVRRKNARQQVEFTREIIDAFQERNYVALSYTWDPFPHSNAACGGYSIQSREGHFYPSEVRDSVYERVKKYMDYFGLCYLWIDRECIAQNAGEEKTTALQAMDLVYSRSEYPLGLLYQPIESLEELELLADLIEGKLSKPGLSFNRASRVLKLLEAIVSDIWWTRAWIYQENYRGGQRMNLLMPHRITSKKHYSRYAELFRDIPGEICFSSTKFLKTATAFCIAFEPHASQKKAKELVLERARRFTVLLEEPSFFDRKLATRSMSSFIITDIEKRQLTNPLDRLPIIANCCQYSVRLDDTKIQRKRHSISLAILALFLLNGEIIYNEQDDENDFADGHKITAFIETQAFSEFSPPESVYGLTYNKGCRFIDVEFTRHGIRTKGHLWKLGTKIHTSKFPETLPYIKDKGSLGRDERRKLKLLADELSGRYKYLSQEIYGYLNRDEAPYNVLSFARQTQNLMAEELAKAIGEGRVLQLAVLWDPSGARSPYRGIFICNDPEADDSEADDVEADDLEADDSEADDSEADDAEADDSELEDSEPEDLELDDSEPDDSEPDDSELDDSEPNNSEPDDPSSYVFTASREIKAEKSNSLPNDVDRYVSLGVDFRLQREGLPFLTTRHWLHGLCFFSGCPTREVIFPWPSTFERF